MRSFSEGPLRIESTKFTFLRLKGTHTMLVIETPSGHLITYKLMTVNTVDSGTVVFLHKLLVEKNPSVFEHQ